MKGKHAEKDFGAVGAMAPAPLSLKTRGGGGLGGVAYKDRARPPPPLITRGRGGLKGGGGGVAGTPLLPGSPYGPRQRRAKKI